MTLSAWDLCFPSIFEDIGDYVPSTTKTSRQDGEITPGTWSVIGRETETVMSGSGSETESEGRDREREEEKKRHSYFEKPKVDEMRRSPWHPAWRGLLIFVAAQPGIEPA